MKFRISYLHFALVLCIFIFLVGIGVPDTAQAIGKTLNHYQTALSAKTTSGLISARESSVEWTAAPAAWSQARMEAARPYPLPEVDSQPAPRNSFSQSGGEPTFIPGVPPASVETAEGTAPSQSTQAISGYDYPAPFTRYENFDSYTTYPYRTIGVLFFTQRGLDYRCSAAVVGKDALWTAGHCVHDGSGQPEGWSENVVFVPAYKNGSEPYGNWVFYDLVTRSSWYSSGDLRFDIGGVVLYPNLSAQSVRDVVGSLGFAYNLNPGQHWFNFGYPTLPPFTGTTMQVCAGSFARNDTSQSFPMPMAMGCDMTPGSSGGPWIINFSGFIGNTNYLNGNNSYHLTGFEDEIYSPYFGDDAKDLLDYISTDTHVSTSIQLPFISWSVNQ